MKTLLIILSIITFKFTYSQTFEGLASWYGYNDNKVRKTANGEIFNENNLTCAAVKEIPFNTLLEVTNIDNGKHIIVRVNDRGGMINTKSRRLIDLPRPAFKKIGNLKKGLINIKVKIINYGIKRKK